MSRSSAAASYHAPENDSSTDASFEPSEAPTWAEDKNPTRPLPVFRLEEEARRLDQAAAIAAMRCDEDATVTVSAEENKKLLASVFSGEKAPETMPSPLGLFRSSEDEPTLDAPAPSSPEAIAAMATPCPARITARPPALKMLVITRPAPVAASRISVAPAAVISDAAVAALPVSLATPAPAPEPAAFVAPPSGFRRRVTPALAEAARELRDAEEHRRSAATFTVRLPKPDTTTYVVAGIWAMALTLIAVLMFMATSA